jgi:hypothetical protein
MVSGLGSKNMSNPDLREWRLRRAKGAIEEHLRGVSLRELKSLRRRSGLRNGKP